MRHNHEERVQSYLKKLNEEEAERMRIAQLQREAMKAKSIVVEDADKGRKPSANAG
jgi:hypothetical protein